MKITRTTMERIYKRILAELKFQRKKYGQEFCDNLSPETWALIIAEETGEVADAVLKLMRKPEDYPTTLNARVVNARNECIQVAATAISTYLAIEKWERETLIKKRTE
jgi:NTP pyrophosphatase (non-canonical NTP hydrolase)